MSDDDQTTDPQHDTTTPDGIENAPRGNPEPDRDAVDKGEENLERVKPY